MHLIKAGTVGQVQGFTGIINLRVSSSEKNIHLVVQSELEWRLRLVYVQEVIYLYCTVLYCGSTSCMHLSSTDIAI